MIESNFLETLRINPSIPSVTERYFKTRIISENSQCILTHSNRLCIVTIAPMHPILTENAQVDSVNFVTVGNKNRLNNKVSGKCKKGGQRLKERSVICTVKTSDGKDHIIYSCISGTLVEVNEKLTDQPNLLREKPWSDGYIGIIMQPLRS